MRGARAKIIRRMAEVMTRGEKFITTRRLYRRYKVTYKAEKRQGFWA